MLTSEAITIVRGSHLSAIPKSGISAKTPISRLKILTHPIPQRQAGRTIAEYTRTQTVEAPMKAIGSSDLNKFRIRTTPA
jgi:hypothetical protein